VSQPFVKPLSPLWKEIDVHGWGKVPIFTFKRWLDEQAGFFIHENMIQYLYDSFCLVPHTNFVITEDRFH